MLLVVMISVYQNCEIGDLLDCLFGYTVAFSGHHSLPPHFLSLFLQRRFYKLKKLVPESRKMKTQTRRKPAEHKRGCKV